MQNEKKVSIITPCLNGEEFVSRYLESILNQTHKNIELIFINDGSTDKTEDIVKSYIPKFKDRGMTLIYIYKENGGQAKALNQGLKLFTGDYLTWPDSDDILTKDSIEKKVSFLENNSNYGIVRSDACIVNENSIDVSIGYFGKNNLNKYKEDLFYDFIIENRVWFAPGCYMIRTESLMEVNPNKDIYEGKGGQNWQMLLPITYKYKCGYIDEPLYKYVVREESHSHNLKTPIELLERYDDHKDILINTIDRIYMSDEEKEKYKNIVEEKYIRKKMYLGIDYKNKKLIQENYKLLKKNYNLTIKDKISFLQGKNEIFNLLVKIIKKTIKLISSLVNIFRKVTVVRG